MDGTRGSALAAAAISALAAAVLGGAARARADEARVKIDTFAFTPETLVIARGTRVTWENGDDIPHNVVSSTDAFRSKAMDTGEQFRFTFTKAGTYAYFCTLHPHMTGTIVVTP